jgi:LuxR family maltose regulon positive regulatory protein
MSAPLLLTKLFIPPPRPQIVLRPRLIERLNEGLQRKVILISAPAGFGKTTLVSEWIEDYRVKRADCGLNSSQSSGANLKSTTQNPQFGWLSLDEGDNQVTRFLTYLVAALQTIAPRIGKEVLAILQSPQPPPTESILTALLNEITTVPDNFVLVLDDYHALDSQPVDAALTFLLDHLPRQMHMVITTREDPHLPLSRLRARGQLTELRAADLRFTPAEAAEFLNRVMGLNLSAENIAALENRTEGWIAGLQLAALSMQGHQDTTNFIKSFTGSHHFVLDYLVEEALQQQSESVQTFLLRTSILDRMCGPLCDAVLLAPSASGQETLEYLEHANLFIVPLDNVRRWYRYHHLFGDVLRMHLMAEQPDQLSALHRRASEWYEHNGSAADAIRHALAAKDFERAATLVELSVPEMRRNRQAATVTELGWLKALPDELVRFRPVLSVAYAYALFGGGELEAVEARLREAERWLDTPDPPDGVRARPESPLAGMAAGMAAGMVVVDEKAFRRLPGMIAMLRTAQALARGNIPETVKNARRVLDLAPEDDYLLLGGAASTLGLAAWASGDLDTARRMISDGMANVRRAGYITPAIGDAITLADIQIAQGCLHEAMSTYERGLQWATEPGAPVLRGAADMYVGMSDLHHERNDLETALKLLFTSQALGELAGMPQNPYRWRAAMARIREAQGDLDGALDLLNQAERLYKANFSPNVRPIATRKVRVWVAQGRLGEALGWAREQGLSAENELGYLHEFDHITLIRVHLALYQKDHADISIQKAMGLLDRLLKAAEERGGKGSVIEILVLQAIAYQAQGDLPAALEPLQKALTLAEPEGYVRLFVDEGLPMIQLLREAASRGITSDYTGKLLTAFEAGERKSQPKADLASAQPLIEPLSQREQKILQLIAQGLSNREIGERLFLALDTVKGYNRKIFDKLQVQSRTEAIARAREFGLL